MPQIPQPVTVEWSPSTAPLAAPSWVPLGRVHAGHVERGRTSRLLDEYGPGVARIGIRNGDNAGGAPQVELDDWRRWTRLRVRADFGSGDRSLFTGFVSKVEHDLGGAPFTGRAQIDAVDAMSLWGRTVIARELADPAEDFRGWPSDVVSIAAEVDADGLGGTPDVSGFAAAPVVLPASIDVDGAARIARFRANGLEALQRALAVELGTVHIAAAGTTAVNGRYAVPDAISPVTGGVPTTVFTLTDDAAELGAGVYPFMRGTLRFADPVAEFRNAVTTSGLRAKAHQVRDAAVGVTEPEDALEFLDLWCLDERWVEANARHLAKLCTGIRAPWPAEVSVVVWDTAMTSFARAAAICDATDILGRAAIEIHHTQPGTATQTVHYASIEGVRWSVTSSQLVATLRLGAGAARWAAAYDLSVGIFGLDKPGHGFDSGAILGP